MAWAPAAGISRTHAGGRTMSSLRPPSICLSSNGSQTPDSTKRAAFPGAVIAAVPSAGKQMADHFALPPRRPRSTVPLLGSSRRA